MVRKIHIDRSGRPALEWESRLNGMAPATNRLSRESSPYLLLHAHNPVDWYPWGEEAFARARSEDKPVFLSVGYSTCYWCHVMERESFSDPEIARQLNEGFVSIKLDREERPDLDEIYMMATQLLTQSGGWPNSVFLTHDRKPFFAGTYFPPADRMGRPGFPRVLTALREAWALRRPEVLEQAEAVSEAMRGQVEDTEDGAPPSPTVAADAQALLARRFDARWGGFGDAPKFPSPANLFFLLDRAREGGDAAAREMLTVTLDRMARGGIHDQIGGGFHRYSTDARWLVPHFEKMLYDNAALARLYAAADPLAPDLGFARVARATVDFVLREMTDEEGSFLSAIDAETGGHEGVYYTWTRDELASAVDGDALALVVSAYGCEGPPTFESERYVLHLPEPLHDRARSEGLSEGRLRERLDVAARALLAARDARERPLLDDKVLADWNGLMIGAAARVGADLDEPRYVEASRRAADALLRRLVDPGNGELLHSYRRGVARIGALLDDYAFVVEGLLELYSVTSDPRWLEEAKRLQAEQDRRLGDGGGYFAAAEAEDLLVRSRPGHDGAVASGNGISALNLLELARLGSPEALARCDRLLGSFGAAVVRWPLAHVSLVRAVARRGAPVPEAARVSPPPPAPQALRDEALSVVEARGRLGEGTGDWRRFELEVTVREGWHLNANPPLLRFLVPTEVSAGSVRLRGVRYPRGDQYAGSVTIEGEVEAPAEGPVSVTLSYQACDEERCLGPVAREVRLR
jgi:uncharacterized protein YyaL (SSP411 family)